MTYEKLDCIVTAILNVLWKGIWIYIVFWLRYSPWWLLVPLIAGGFKESRNKEEEL